MKALIGTLIIGFSAITYGETCSVDSYWTQRLDAKAAPFKSLSETERSQVVQALSKLPKILRPASLKAIVTSPKPFDITTPNNPATSTEKYIILYPRAFAPQEPLERILTHEMVHVLAAKDWSKQLQKFKKDLGWTAAEKRHTFRSGDFVEDDGKTSADEDFANSVEYYVFENASLAKKSPQVRNWLEKEYGKKLTAEAGCTTALKPTAIAPAGLNGVSQVAFGDTLEQVIKKAGPPTANDSETFPSEKYEIAEYSAADNHPIAVFSFEPTSKKVSGRSFWIYDGDIQRDPQKLVQSQFPKSTFKTYAPCRGRGAERILIDPANGVFIAILDEQVRLVSYADPKLTALRIKQFDLTCPQLQKGTARTGP